MKYARFAHLPCWTDNKLDFVLCHISPRIIPYPMRKEIELVGMQETECPCLNQTVRGGGSFWHVGPVGAIYLPARASEHICTMRLACKQTGSLLFGADKCRGHSHLAYARLTCRGVVTNTNAGICIHTDTHCKNTPEFDMHYLVFALLHCRANSCSSKSNLSNRLWECFCLCVCFIILSHTVLEDSE